MKDLKDKVVLITGAAHGIGRETAWAFAREGASLVLADVNAGWLDETVEGLKAQGHDALGIQVDLRDREQVYRMVDRAQEEKGPVDILVNNAGVAFAKQIMDLVEQEITNTIEVNLYGPIWATRRVLPQMLERKSGHIVNVASAAGKTTNPYLSVYCATKSGLIGFTDAINQELHHRGISATVVNPAWISSGMFRGAKRIKYITRWVTPECVARAIVLSVKRNKAEIHVPRRMWLGGMLRALLGPKVMAKLWRLFRGDRLFSGVVGHE